MTATISSGDVYTNIQGLSTLRHEAASNSPTALRAVGKHFEALFIQMMLKSMRQASPGDPLFGGKEGELYRDLFDKQISEDLSSHGGIGLADIIVRQLQHDSRSQQTQATDVTTTANQAVLPPNNGKDTVSYASPTDFIKAVWPHAQQAAQQLGVDPEVLVAQTALETGWGRGIIHHADGRSSHNLFGIKAGGGWKKETVAVPTIECRDGVVV